MTPSVASFADTLVAHGDSTGALLLLERLIRESPRDASLWHRRGMIAWKMARDRRTDGVLRDARDIDLIADADSSLRLAAAYAPDSARFSLDLGRFDLNSNLVTLRSRALSHFTRALDAARRTGDRFRFAEAADETGMAYWRRYEAVADRRNLRGIDAPDFDRYVNDPRELRTYFDNFSAASGTDWSGQGDYVKATDLFSEALRADSGNVRALRHVFMGLAERRRWEELRDVARARTTSAPWDGLGWLARGLATHRLGDDREATVAFDSALAYVSDADRVRYTRLSKILRPSPPKGSTDSDSAKYDRSSPAHRESVERVYWLLADPLALTAVNEHRLEFLSRITFAELRWTSDDFALRGMDTDRGDIHIRYGPPSLIAGFAPVNGASTVLWLYDDGLSFVFRQPPTWGTASIAGEFAEKARQLRAATPVRWGNVPITRSLDSLRVQLARFRGAGDSTDAVLVARVPVARLVSGLDLRQGTVDVAFLFYAPDAAIVRKDSSRLVVDVEAPDAREPLRSWRMTVGRDAQLYRVEALQPDGGRAARALGTVVPLGRTALSTSDLLVADRVLPRSESAGERWTDFNVVPNVGRFASGAPVGLLWETYGLTADKDGGARYRISITLDKVQRTGPVGIALRVMGGVKEVTGRTAKGRGRVTLSFDRQVAARPVVTDYLTLDLGSAPSGRYRMELEVTDLVSRQTTTTRREITVLEPEPR